jgi:drug/metabolite transporter (DMT)-like permease
VVTEKKDIFSHGAAALTLLALLAASIEPIMVKLGYRGQVTPWQLLVMKTSIAALLILPLTGKFRWIQWHGVRRIAGVSVLLLFNNLFTLLALEHISAIMYLTLVTTNPSIIALINSKRGRERLDLKFWLGFILCFAGVLLTLNIRGMAQGETHLAGVLLVLGSMACTIIYRTRMEDITAEFSPGTVSVYIFWVNAAIVLAFVAPWAGPIPLEGWKTGAWLGFAAAVANVAFLAALHILGSTRISIFNMLQRPMVMIAASIILHEPLSLLQAAGIVMVLAGIHLAKVQRISKEVGEEEPGRDHVKN